MPEMEQKSGIPGVHAGSSENRPSEIIGIGVVSTWYRDELMSRQSTAYDLALRGYRLEGYRMECFYLRGNCGIPMKLG